MPYKNRDRQREANAAAQRRRRRVQGMTKGMTEQQGMTPGPADLIPNFGQPDCQCAHCRAMRANNPHGLKSINHGKPKTLPQLAKNEVNRVSLPGDVDYEGVCKAE